MKHFFTIVFSFFSFLLFSQSNLGSISGIIIDGNSKETIIGANIFLVGTDKGTATDYDGFYSINNVQPGKYSVSISYIGYQTMTISEVDIQPGGKVTLDIIMSTDAQLLEEITVTEYKKTNTVAAVLLDVKQSRQVVSGVSNQQIQRSQDNNAAQVMSRIPGITVYEGRFVMIRGLSERYNSVMINNVIAPSTEIDKRTFSFDLIPANALDRMLIYKSGSPEYPGDYAGGVIKLFTLDEVESNFSKFNVAIGYRAGTTFGEYLQTKGSASDFLGFDNGFRKLPSSFPSTSRLQRDPRNGLVRLEAAKSLSNNFLPESSTASPDFTLGYSFGRNFNIGRTKVSAFNVLNYSSSFQQYFREFNRYFALDDTDAPINSRFRFIDNTFEKQNRISLMSNWKFRISDNSRISFKNLFNQIGENETILRNGFDFIQRPNQDLSYYLFGYRSRSIYSGQLEGNHQLSSGMQLRWVFGGSFLNEIEPDLRRFRTFRPFGLTDQNFTMIDPPSSNLFDTGRYFGQLKEYSFNQGADFSVSKFKFGYFADYRDRDFASRYVSYLYPGFFNPNVLARLKQLPLNEVFAPENISNVDGWVMEEGTRGIDSYTASSLTLASYASTEYTFGNTDISLGVRAEYNRQKLESLGDNELIQVNNPTFSVLPFLNTAYKFSEDRLVRFAYAMTVNRPEFRELAPFAFYDYKYDANRIGEPGLVSANIHNFDLRFETYPRIGETFSIGAFYKYFINPIENRTIITSELPTFSFINADWARNYGIEIEFRKSLRGLTGNQFLDGFSFNTNASLIFSNVDLGESVSLVQDQVRPLQGQSPYILNIAIYYENPKSDITAALVYNIFGNRIFSVGDRNFPTIYELSRNGLDATLSKKIGKISYKVGVQNILNAPFRFFEDSNRDERIDLRKTGDNPILVFRRGALANLSLSFHLN
jgi:hypothetical protein